jgi:hypothetical protein
MTHTHRFLQHLAKVSLVTAATGLVEGTSAQTPRFRVTDLVNLGDATINAADQGTMS